MRTLDQWARQLPRDLRQMDDTALVEIRRAAVEGAKLARDRVPVVTGALQRSIGERSTDDGAEVYSDDPAAQALADAGRPIIRDAVLEAAGKFPRAVTEQWTEDLTGAF